MTRFSEEWLADRLAKQRKAAAPAAPKPAKRLKYGNRKVVIDGIQFDSSKEGRRWQDLKLLETAGEIHSLETQVRYKINVNGEHICDYIADFVYMHKGLTLVVEDVKSEATRKLPAFRLKKKLMKAVLGIDISEV